MPKTQSDYNRKYLDKVKDKKHDIKIEFTNEKYNEIEGFCNKRGLKKAAFVKEAVEHKING